ncbi:expressed unknown protein [Seminavis robusta]|uniref:Uncharacterized protein n=1 Tax=Seminavis robusta TaxID=568900 RepID=A0A9N8HWU9_9STRA|nr:expressed unknown protein [Seminavis robusta]|eukprot:Sro2803_g337420.1 n/a (430) ;mRNA; r:5393-6682
MNDDDSFESGPLRVGTWTAEEKAYMYALMDEFKNGSLDLADGTTMRWFLGDRLHCGVKRISKKMEGYDYKGRHCYHRQRSCTTPEEVNARKEKLQVLRNNFLASLEKLRLPGSKAYKEEQAKKKASTSRKTPIKRNAAAVAQQLKDDSERERANLLEAIAASSSCDDNYTPQREQQTQQQASFPSRAANSTDAAAASTAQDNQRNLDLFVPFLERKIAARNSIQLPFGVNSAGTAGSFPPSLLLGTTNHHSTSLAATRRHTSGTPFLTADDASFLSRASALPTTAASNLRNAIAFNPFLGLGSNTGMMAHNSFLHRTTNMGRAASDPTNANSASLVHNPFFGNHDGLRMWNPTTLAPSFASAGMTTEVDVTTRLSNGSSLLTPLQSRTAAALIPMLPGTHAADAVRKRSILQSTFGESSSDEHSSKRSK